MSSRRSVAAVVGIPWRSVCLLIAVGLTIALILILRDTFDPAVRAQALAEARRQTQLAHELKPIDLIAGAIWRLLPPIAAIAAGGVALLIVWRRYGARESIAADKLIHAQRAQHTPLPAHLHTLTIQQPSRSVSERSFVPSAPALLTGVRDEAPRDPPTFAQLLAAGTIGADIHGGAQPLLFGFSEQGPVRGSLKSLYSAGIGGLQGSGKTWTAADLLAQSALAGARLLIGDPHAGDAESLAMRVQALAPAFVCDIAQTESDIRAALTLAYDELHARKHGDPNREPWIVALDEWTSLRRGTLAELLPRLIEEFSTEGRKYNINALLLGQRWDKQSVGDFRNTLSSSIVHRMRPEEARMMTGLRAGALPADTLTLQPGEAYLLDSRGTLVRIKTPYTTQADIDRVGERLQLERASHGDRPLGFTAYTRQHQDDNGNNRLETVPKPESETGNTASQRNVVFDAQTLRILRLFVVEKRSIGEIVKATWPQHTSGTPYNERRAEVEALIREYLQRCKQFENRFADERMIEYDSVC